MNWVSGLAADVGRRPEHELAPRSRGAVLLGRQVAHGERRRGRGRIVDEHRERADARRLPGRPGRDERRTPGAKRVERAGRLERALAVEHVEHLVGVVDTLLPVGRDEPLRQELVRVKAAVGRVGGVDRVAHRP